MNSAGLLLLLLMFVMVVVLAMGDEAEEGAEAEAEAGGEEEDEVEEDRARGLRGFFTKHVLQWLPGVEALGVGSPLDLREIGETSAPPKRASAFT